MFKYVEDAMQFLTGAALFEEFQARREARQRRTQRRGHWRAQPGEGERAPSDLIRSLEDAISIADLAWALQSRLAGSVERFESGVGAKRRRIQAEFSRLETALATVVDYADRRLRDEVSTEKDTNHRSGQTTRAVERVIEHLGTCPRFSTEDEGEALRLLEQTTWVLENALANLMEPAGADRPTDPFRG